MPYVLSPIISHNLPSLWGEGSPYTSQTIYDIHSTDPQKPPVQYKSHNLKPHSLPHLDAPGHTLSEGCSVDWFFKSHQLSGFYGRVTVVRLPELASAGGYRPCKKQKDHFVWSVSRAELSAHLPQRPDRLLLTSESTPLNEWGLHDSRYALVLDLEAAEYLCENKKFCTFGTSWKSIDYQPGERTRPIHKIFLSQKINIFECLSLHHVPSGEYVWMAFPLPLEGASESPVCPVLFTHQEWANLFKEGPVA